jgi:hypothetical protein
LGNPPRAPWARIFGKRRVALSLFYNCAMEILQRIVQVDRVSNGLLIFFQGGRVAFYSESLLYSVLEEAQELPEWDSEE